MEHIAVFCFAKQCIAVVSAVGSGESVQCAMCSVQCSVQCTAVKVGSLQCAVVKLCRVQCNGESGAHS